MVDMRETTWRPDTCKCVVTYAFEYDDNGQLIPDQEPTPISVILCNDHINLPSGLQNRFNYVLEQNQRKNDLLMEAYMELDMTEDSTVMKRLMEQYVDRWYMTGFDEDRVVHLVMKNMTQGRKNALQRRANNKYGSGKVEIE